jgi:hypothetical protein
MPGRHADIPGAYVPSTVDEPAAAAHAIGWVLRARRRIAGRRWARRSCRSAVVVTAATGGFVILTEH